MRLFGKRSKARPSGRSTPPAPEPDPGAVAGLRSYLAGEIHPGFLALDEVIDRAIDYRDGEGLERSAGITDDVVDAVAREEWGVRAAAIAAGDAASPQPDASSRLSAAFRALESDGIVARMDFTCCQTCGHAEIGDERGDARDELGYTFFHSQDSEAIVDGHLYLAFGPFRNHPDLPPELVARAETADDSPEREAARREVYDRSEQVVADTVAARLREAGLAVDWNGSTTARISVDVADWRRPLPV